MIVPNRIALPSLLLVAALSGSCNSPKTDSGPPSQPAKTRTQAILTRENQPLEANTMAATAPSSRSAEPPGQQQALCTLSMASRDLVVDCSFAPCPRPFLAQMAASESVSLMPDGKRWKLLPLRSTPPLNPMGELFLEPGTHQLWTLTGVPLGDQKASCSVAGKAFPAANGSEAISMDSLSVRTSLGAQQNR